MEVFGITLRQMLMLFTFISVGFILRKARLVPENAGNVLSKVEMFVFVPALYFYNQMTQTTVATFTDNAPLLLYGTLFVVGAILLSYALSYIFVRRGDTAQKRYLRCIYRYALSFGNFGFLGNYLVLGVFGAEAFYKYTLFTFPLTILCNSWGMYVLIPKEEGASIWKSLRRGLLTPPTVALVLGAVLGILGVKEFFPAFLTSALNDAGLCQGPVAMLIAGIVIGGYRLRGLLTKWAVYGATALRLIVIPAAMLLLLRLIGAGEELMTFVLVAFAAPLGLNTVVIPAAYGGDTETGAAMATISHTLAIITIPIMYLIFIA